MGHAGGEGLAASLSGAHPEDGDEKTDVGDHYDTHHDQDDGASVNEGTKAGILLSEQENLTEAAK